MNPALDAPAAVIGKAPMQALLDLWAERGWLRTLDTAFARFLWEEAPTSHPLLILAAALASHQLGRGHACLDLPATLADPGFALSLPPEGSVADDPLLAAALPARVLSGVDLARWLAALQDPSLISSGDGSTPLVLVGARLYLRRYWQAEQDVRLGIDQRLAAAAALQARVPTQTLRDTLDTLFSGDTANAEPEPASLSPRPESATSNTRRPCNWQKLACALATRSAFSIITGGPGTGKTTTVVRILALLQTLALQPVSGGPPPRALRIRLAAPTGKAAARLKGSIATAIAKLPLASIAHGEAVRAAIPAQVTTVHRLLGSRPDTRHFRHDANSPLTLDVLVIDEASMIDLDMMAAVLAALPANARLILLGDKDQLASVEAGAVLGQLCQRASAGHYTAASASWLELASGETIAPDLIDSAGRPIDQAIVMLRHSHRFSADSGIGQLANAVNAGDTAAVANALEAGANDVTALTLAGQVDPGFRQLIIDGGPGGAGIGYRHYLDIVRTGSPERNDDPAALDAWAAAVLGAHSRFQVLCALRRGPWGVAGLNERIAQWLHADGLIPAVDGWYPGRPVLVTRNDHALGLMNGDIGVTLAVPASDGPRLRVAFAAHDQLGGIRWVLPVRLQSLETVFALTVHKSQGSEFEHAALVLPDTSSPILTRELIYTGITRARDHLTLVQSADPRILKAAVQKRVIRAGGLMSG